MTTRAARLAALDAVCFDASGRWSEQAWSGELDAAGASIGRFLLEERAGERIVGAVSVMVAGDTADLLRIMVHPDRRGTGLGTRLLRRALAEAAGRGATRMLLEVRPDNLPALALYRAHGFVPIAERPGYYGPGRDALVMEASLPV